MPIEVAAVAASDLDVPDDVPPECESPHVVASCNAICIRFAATSFGPRNVFGAYVIIILNTNDTALTRKPSVNKRV